MSVVEVYDSFSIIFFLALMFFLVILVSAVICIENVAYLYSENNVNEKNTKDFFKLELQLFIENTDFKDNIAVTERRYTDFDDLLVRIEEITENHVFGLCSFFDNLDDDKLDELTEKLRNFKGVFWCGKYEVSDRCVPNVIFEASLKGIIYNCKF